MTEHTWTHIHLFNDKGNHASDGWNAEAEI